MSLLKCILRYSAILLLLTVTLAPAAPVTAPEPEVLPLPTTASPNGQEEVELESTSSPISTSGSSPAPTTEEMPTGSGQPPSTNGGSFTDMAVIVTTESPHGSFDCSATSSAAQAHATASLLKGLSLVIDDLSYDHLRVSTYWGIYICKCL